MQEFWLWCQQKNYSALNLFGFRFKTRIYLVWKLVGGEKKYRSWRLKDAVFNWVETDHISAPSRGEIYWGPSQLLLAAEYWPSSSSWFESLSVLPQALNLPSKEKTHLLLCLFTNGLQFSDFILQIQNHLKHVKVWKYKRVVTSDLQRRISKIDRVVKMRPTDIVAVLQLS